MRGLKINIGSKSVRIKRATYGRFGFDDIKHVLNHHRKSSYIVINHINALLKTFVVCVNDNINDSRAKTKSPAVHRRRRSCDNNWQVHTHTHTRTAGCAGSALIRLRRLSYNGIERLVFVMCVKINKTRESHRSPAKTREKSYRMLRNVCAVWTYTLHVVRICLWYSLLHHRSRTKLSIRFYRFYRDRTAAASRCVLVHDLQYAESVLVLKKTVYRLSYFVINIYEPICRHCFYSSVRNTRTCE